MNYSITPFQEGVTPPVVKPNPQFLQEIGENGMRQLLERFYLCLFESPINDLFPSNRDEMKIAAQTSADFFIQICGGPDYFNQNRGAPQMRGRHAPFKITPEARLHWLVCFENSLEPVECDEANKQSFWNYIDIFSLWMINSR